MSTNSTPVPKPGEKFPNGITVRSVNEGTIHYTKEGSGQTWEVPLALWDVISAEQEVQNQWPSVLQVKASHAAR
ncbi:MAG: hypothetical protein GWQ05_00320 [Verrucomicrobiaceae bacterium]|jgi:hypothetical protein|nr:hypothetical protein [Verrucomicrobiales bacterium]MDF1785051.1 hypothetical protein [Verrucomicrobiales bacterium]NCF89400.1 hypothetical protein [Verrucomicrobiaceae bacterium]